MGKEPALPKNIRQIGEIDGRERVCIEDYVMTYIHKKEQQEEKGYLGIFFGEQQETEDLSYVFIRGIFEIPAEAQERGALREEYEKYFGEWSVQGCCVIGTYPTERMKALAEWLPEAGRLIYHLQEQEETLYWTREERYQRLHGYFVFYEQNRKMQEYLAEVFKDSSVEKESVPDRAIRSFREKVKEKGERKHSSFLRMASSFFVITILIIGAIVVNRIEDIRMARSLPLTDGEASVYQPRAEKETASPDALTEDAVQSAAAAAQYIAAQQAAEEAELAGSDAFWEESVLEDDPAWEESSAGVSPEISGSGDDSASGILEASGFDGDGGTADAALASAQGEAQDIIGEAASGEAAAGEEAVGEAADIASAPVQGEMQDTAGDAALASAQGEAQDTAGEAALASVQGEVQDTVGDAALTSAQGEVQDTAGDAALALAQGEAQDIIGEIGTGEATSGEAADAASAPVQGEVQDIIGEAGAGEGIVGETADAASALMQGEMQDTAGDAALASAQGEAQDTVGDAASGETADAASASVQGEAQDTVGDAAAGEAQEAAAVRQTQAGYVIKAGDTLADICSRYYGNIDRLEEICTTNGIKDANMILPGQRIVLP